MITSDKIGITLIPNGGDEGEVDAVDFQAQLGSLLAALKESAKTVNEDTAGQVRYKIENISNNSPLDATFRAEPCFASDGVNIPEIMERFNQGVRFILGEVDRAKGMTFSWLAKMVEFCKPIGGTISSVRLRVGSEVHVLGIDFKKRLSEIEAKDFIEKQSHIKGKLEAMNIHGKNAVFMIYPDVGPEKVRCILPSSLVEAARKSFGEHVVVNGDLKYHWKELFPYEVKVSSIRIIPSVSNARDIKGIAPNATRGISTEDYISLLRDDG